MKKIKIFFDANNFFMNKKDFLEKLSFKSNFSKTDCQKFLQATYDVLCESLKKGESVSFKGFGKFFVKEKNERIIKNNLKNTYQIVLPKNFPCFKIGKSFKKIVC